MFQKNQNIARVLFAREGEECRAVKENGPESDQGMYVVRSLCEAGTSCTAFPGRSQKRQVVIFISCSDVPKMAPSRAPNFCPIS
jgi:hypothetical protein